MELHVFPMDIVSRDEVDDRKKNIDFTKKVTEKISLK